MSVIALIACSPLMFAQQQVTMTGKVLDENSQPMTGVAVLQKGTLNGVVTDIDGKYSINAPEGSVIQFSFIGYSDKEVQAILGNMDVHLTPDTQALDESVVVGYGVQKRSSLTGSISSVGSEDMENRTSTDLAQAMQGKTSGVQVISSSAAPGSNPTIRIRGYSSNVSSDPLYVVDGVRVTDIGSIDPNDIESMEILKDAASAAIYGAQAGNGVVLITTKRGKSGDGKIKYDFQYSIQSLSKSPKLLNSEEFIQYLVEGGLSTEEYLLKTWDGETNTSWADVAFERGAMQRHNISMSNGNENGNYYVSLSYLDFDGIGTGDKDTFQRLTGTINGEWKIKKWLTVGTTNMLAKYTIKSLGENNENGSFFSGIWYMDPITADTYTYDNLPSHMYSALQNGYTLLTNSKGEYYGVSPLTNSENYHPLIYRDHNQSTADAFVVTGSAYVNFNPFKFLTYTSRFGYRLIGSRSSTTNLPYYGNATQTNLYVAQSNTSSTTLYYQWENFLNYNQTFGKHTIGAMVGMSFDRNTYDYVTGSVSANGEDALTKNDPLFYYLNYASASSTKGVAGETTITSKYSWFGRVNYEYAGKYLVQASLRADSADLSYLPLSGRWGYFPAVSLGWVISEEKFFENARDKVDQLKLRASWGQNGSIAALGSYAYSTEMTTGGIYPLVSGNNYTTGVYPTSLGNPDLKWETSEQWDIGIDTRFFNNRLNFSMDWYTKKTKDLLVTGTTPSLIIGGTTAPVNAGNVSNRGFEFDLGWKDTAGDFYYSISANLSTLRNRATYLDESLSRLGGTQWRNQYMTYFEIGYPIYYFRGFKFTGIDPSTGDPMFADLNGDGEVTDDDQGYIGKGIPDVTYGITLNFAWKGIDLVIFGSGVAGNNIWNLYGRSDYPLINRMKEIYYDDRWTTTNTSGSVPRANANDMDNYMRSSATIYDGSYFKIKQIQLGYTFPKRWMSKVKVSNLRLYVSLDDFFTFSSYPGLDPEASVSSVTGIGLDKGTYPSTRKIVFGLNLEF